MARFWLIGMAVACVGALTGGCGCDGQCVPSISDETSPVSEADLPAAWTRGDLTSFRIIVTPGPYRVGEHALEQLRSIIADQAGLDVEVVEGEETGLSDSGVLDYNDVVAAVSPQIPSGNDAVTVLVVVNDTNAPDATYGFVRYKSRTRPTSVIVLHRGPMNATAFGPVTLDVIEATVTVHEVGHWLGVPARDFHISALDRSHCSCARCVMHKGLKYNPVCVVAANLRTGVPVRFCPDCAEELSELKRRREANR